MTKLLKTIWILIIFLFLFHSCSRRVPPPPERIPFSFYIRDWDATKGAPIGPSRFSYGKGLVKTYHRLRESLNFSINIVPEKHYRKPKTMLSAYLSVWNPDLYRALYMSAPIEQFDNNYISSFRRAAPPRKKEERKEHLKILMEYKSYSFNGINYFFSRDTFYKYTGEQEEKCFCLQQVDEKWYFNDYPEESVKIFFNFFCDMKLDVAKAFFENIPSAYPGYELKHPLPASGNKYLDEELMQIYIATHTHQYFNVDKFHQLQLQWEREGKQGVLNYFFEN